MRVAVCVDMVGLTGIDRYQQCFPAWPREYRHGVRMLVGDLEAAVGAALEAGATDVVLADWHHLGRNVPRPAFPHQRIRRLWRGGRPDPGSQGLGRPDAAILLGIHAAAGNPEGFFSHTFWRGMAVLLDDAAVPEAALWALALGGAGIPVAALAGDQRALEEASDLLPGVPGVSLKAGTSRTSAILRPAPDARAELAETVRMGLARPAAPLARSFPTHATIRFGDAVHAARAAGRGVGERTGDRHVTTRLGSVHDLMPFLARGLMATSLGRAAGVRDLLLPSGAGPGSAIGAAWVHGMTGWAERRALRAWAREPAARYPRVGTGAVDEPGR